MKATLSYPLIHLNSPSTSNSKDDAYLIVNAALMAKIEMLESENAALKQKVSTTEKAPGLEDVMHDAALDKLLQYLQIL